MTTKKITSKMYELTNEEGKFVLTNVFGTWMVYAPNGKKLKFANRKDAMTAINLRFHLYAK